MVFQLGDIVWIHYRKEIFPSEQKSKLMPRADRPFEILGRAKDNAYKVNFFGDYGLSPPSMWQIWAPTWKMIIQQIWGKIILNKERMMEGHAWDLIKSSKTLWEGQILALMSTKKSKHSYTSLLFCLSSTPCISPTLFTFWNDLDGVISCTPTLIQLGILAFQYAKLQLIWSPFGQSTCPKPKVVLCQAQSSA